MNLNWKKIGLSLLYPHIAVIICLLPVATTSLVLSLVFLGTTSILAIISYLLAFYELLVICFRMPRIIKALQKFKETNKFALRWFSDVHLRIKTSLLISSIGNVVFGVFQLVLGIYFNSFWFYALAAYYAMLGAIRLLLLKHTRKFKTHEAKELEIIKYVVCGWMLLAINLALAVIVFFMLYWGRTFYHNMITTIAIAAYTFLTFTFAIINVVKYRKYNSPVYSAAKSISLISATVSMLTLEATMLTTFGSGENPLMKQILLSLTSFVVIGFAVTLAIIMIIKGNKQLKNNKHPETD